MQWPEYVRVCEVGPRDGFQNEDSFIPTESKIEIIDMLSMTGIAEIQASSFTHPKAIPQLADAEAVFAGIERKPGVVYSALVPNERGAERALRARADKVDVVVSVSKSHSLSNTRMEPDAALEAARRVASLCRAEGVRAAIGIATAFGCPFEGFAPASRAIEFTRRAIETCGFDEVALADTAGMAGPAMVYDVMNKLISDFSGVSFRLHLHDTRRLGFANVVAGMQAGVVEFDSSVAGLGGCPYAPGASGNVATEDLLNMLSLIGCSTDGDAAAVLACARKVREVVGHADSAVLQAGMSSSLDSAE